MLAQTMLRQDNREKERERRGGRTRTQVTQSNLHWWRRRQYRTTKSKFFQGSDKMGVIRINTKLTIYKIGLGLETRHGYGSRTNINGSN